MDSSAPPQPDSGAPPVQGAAPEPDYVDQVLVSVRCRDFYAGCQSIGMQDIELESPSSPECWFGRARKGPGKIAHGNLDDWGPVCAKDPRGAVWSTWVQQKERALGRYEGSWQLGRREPGGRVLTSPVQAFWGFHFDASVENSPPRAIGFFDYDGDGVFEVLVYANEGVNNARMESRVRIWSKTSWGTLGLYAPAKSFVVFAAGDVDQDSRPDLFVNPYASSTREPTYPLAMYPKHSTLKWGLLAHSQPDGSFSMTSAVALDVARRLCAEQDSQAMPDDPDAWPEFLHCRKLHGASAKDLEQLVKGRCLEPTQSQQAACKYGKKFLQRLVRTSLPVRL